MWLKLSASAVLGFSITSAAMLYPQKKAPNLHIGQRLTDLARLSSEALVSRAFAQSSVEVDRLVLIKSLYFFVNGGTAGTWPKGETGELSGGSAPNDRLTNGFLGVVNSVIGPEGDVSTFLESQGYTSCAALPDTATEFSVDDEHEGPLTVTVSSSSKEIPSGFVNSGNFEKRIFIEKEDGTDLAAIHLHCSSTVMTMLVRMDTDLMTEGQTEAVEILMEGTESGNDVHLQFITQNSATPGQDLALKFLTEDGDNYSIYLAFTSGNTDANGNGPAHIVAGVAGSRTDKKAKLHVMGGNTDITGASVSNDVAGLPFDTTQAVDQMAAGNQFCINTETAAAATDCATLAAPGTPGVTGLSAWTLDGIYGLRQGTTNVAALSAY